MEKDKLIYDTSAEEAKAKLEREKQAMQAAIEHDRIREDMKKQAMLTEEKPKLIYNEYIIDEDKNKIDAAYYGRDGKMYTTYEDAVKTEDPNIVYKNENKGRSR